MIHLISNSGGKFIKIVTEFPDEYRAVTELLTVSEAGYNAEPGREEVLIFVDDSGSYTFYGYLDYLVEYLPKIYGLSDISVVRRGVNSDIPDDGLIENCIPGYSLYDYQLNAVRKIFYHKHGTVVIPTGGGKTLVMAAAVKLINSQTIIVVPTVPLALQTYRKFLSYGYAEDEVGVVGGGHRRFAKYTVMTADSALRLVRDKRNGPFVRATEVMVIDEFHHTQAKSWRELYMGLKHVGYTLCFTGTMYRSLNPIEYKEAPKPHLVKHFDDFITVGVSCGTISSVSIRYLIENGYVAQPIATMTPVGGSPKHDIRGWQGAYRACIENSVTRNRMIADGILQSDRIGFSSMTFISYKRHAEKIAALIPYEIRDRVMLIFGNSQGMKYRGSSLTSCSVDYDLIANRMNSGELLHIVCTPIYDEGVDFPGVGYIQLGFVGKSMIKLFQRSGRGIRTNEGRKKYTFVRDFWDSGHYFLTRHSKMRLEYYKVVGVPVVDGPEFYRMMADEKASIDGGVRNAVG